MHFLVIKVEIALILSSLSVPKILFARWVIISLLIIIETRLYAILS
nr:MAG TPA: hypothetical protein [Caudoviricetes sp.]DAT16629.1 MAG TPA: hypothetical protein [Caudoviricetes sp.]DAW73529.1 MAG TPA: hypothetical protein [Caudoviricetes sp.]DAX26121.1 MAG TPA: hypothetical protein [Caudoviricetes sp.]